MRFRCAFCAHVPSCFRNERTVSHVHRGRVQRSGPSRGDKNGMFANLLSAPTAFEMFFNFHSIVFLKQLKNYQRSTKLDEAAKTIPTRHQSGMCIVLAIPLVIKAWKLVFVEGVLKNVTVALRHSCIPVGTKRSLKFSKRDQMISCLCHKEKDSK